MGKLKAIGVCATYLAFCCAAGFAITVASYAGFTLAEKAIDKYNDWKENR